MFVSLRNPKELFSGIVYVSFGAATVFMARQYSFGNSTAMGPGYFPAGLGASLVVLGTISIVRGLLKDGEGLERFGWRGLLLVTGATVMFGLLLRPAGVVIAVLALVCMGGLASDQSRVDLAASLTLIGILVFCITVFVFALGLPLPLLGYWFQR